MLNDNSIDDISDAVMSIPELKTVIWNKFLNAIEDDSKTLCQKRASYLYSNGYEALQTFSWEKVVEELCSMHSYLADVLLAAAIPLKQISHQEKFEKLIKQLGMVYSILMKSVYKDLSRTQRVVAMTLTNEKAHQKV